MRTDPSLLLTPASPEVPERAQALDRLLALTVVERGGQGSRRRGPGIELAAQFRGVGGDLGRGCEQQVRALVRIGDDVYAIGDRCSHADVSLSEGEVLCDEREIECWKHGSSFSLATGEPQTLPATQPVPVYSAHIEGDQVVVEVA